MKRRRNDTLTGGTRDVSPQLLTVRVTQSAADTATTGTLAIPVQRLPTGNMAQVMEILKVYIVTTTLPVSASVAETSDTISVFISTSNFGATATAFNEPRVFAGYIVSQDSAFTAGGTYMAKEHQMPYQLDLTDGAGHGVLIATDNIFIQVTSVLTGAANTADVKFLYRWKNVALQEYIGIVQSQQ